MPRTHELLQEDTGASEAFTGQYGIHPNAEALLAAHRANLDPALEAASLKPINNEATAELDLSKIKPERGGTVLAASVRGNAIVYVAEGTDGREYKGIEPYEGRTLATSETPEAAAHRAALREETKFSEVANRVNANVEAKVEEFRRELAAEAAEVLADEREKLHKEASKAADSAQKEAEKEQKAAAKKVGTDETPAKGETPPSDPAQGGGPKQASDKK